MPQTERSAQALWVAQYPQPGLPAVPETSSGHPVAPADVTHRSRNGGQ